MGFYVKIAGRVINTDNGLCSCGQVLHKDDLVGKMPSYDRSPKATIYLIGVCPICGNRSIKGLLPDLDPLIVEAKRFNGLEDQWQNEHDYGYEVSYPNNEIEWVLDVLYGILAHVSPDEEAR